MPAARAGEDQPERVDAGLLLGAGLLDPGGEPVRQRVLLRGADGVGGAAVLAALGRLDVQLPGDLDELAVHRDDPGAGAIWPVVRANSSPCRSPA